MNRLFVLAWFLFLALVVHADAASSPLGIGLAESSAGTKWFPAFFQMIAAWQEALNQQLRAALSAMKNDPTAFLWLAALSFGYGVLHAVGPGHGKAIVSSYVLANRETARNGALLALISALAQGVTAVLVVSLALFVFNMTAIALTRSMHFFEIAAFGMMTALGALLVWRKIIRPAVSSFTLRYAPVLPLAVAGSHGEAHHAFHHHHGEGDHGCGCHHLPERHLAEGPFDWKKAWVAITAIGARPCTGALIVLILASSQGLFLAGILATFAMALGTGLTVALLTLGATASRYAATQATHAGKGRERLHAAIEGAAALFVFFIGLALLGGSLA